MVNPKVRSTEKKLGTEVPDGDDYPYIEFKKLPELNVEPRRLGFRPSVWEKGSGSVSNLDKHVAFIGAQRRWRNCLSISYSEIRCSTARRYKQC